MRSADGDYSWPSIERREFQLNNDESISDMLAGVKDRLLGDAVKCACGAAVWCCQLVYRGPVF
jgi:hypothetical protein